MNDNIFLPKRFRLFLYWDFTHHWRSYAHYIGGLGLALGILYALQLFGSLPLVCGASGWEEAQDWYMIHVEQWGGVTAAILGVLAVVWGVYIPAGMQTKAGAIAFLMVPASRLEKYLGRLLSTLVVSIGGGLLATVAADVVHALLSLAFASGHVGSLTLATLQSLFSPPDMHFAVTVRSDSIGALSQEGGGLPAWPTPGAWLALRCAVVLFVHSTYALGGLLFRRHALLLTTVWHFVLWCLVVPALLTACALRTETVLWGVARWGSTWAWGLTGLFVLLALCCHLLAFRLLSRRQAVL